MPLTAGALFASVDQAQHAPGYETTSLLPDGAAFGVRFSAVDSDRLGEQNNGPHEFVVMLDGVGKTKSELIEVFYGLHQVDSPSSESKRETGSYQREACPMTRWSARHNVS